MLVHWLTQIFQIMKHFNNHYKRFISIITVLISKKKKKIQVLENCQAWNCRDNFFQDSDFCFSLIFRELVSLLCSFSKSCLLNAGIRLTTGCQLFFQVKMMFHEEKQLVSLTAETIEKWKLLSRLQLFVTPWTIQSMEFSRTEYWVLGSLSLLWEFFPTQRSNPGLPHYRWILYQLLLLLLSCFSCVWLCAMP